MDHSRLQSQDPTTFDILQKEEARQKEGIELIASENYISPAVMSTLSTVFTNKYSEGLPGKRYYGGNQYIDEIENLAIERAKKLFSADHANVQPHSGNPANMAAYFALMEPGDSILGLSLDHGGHLSHGLGINFSGKYYNFIQYKTDPKTGYIDMDQVRDLARRHRPRVILAGFSAYSRTIDWKLFKEIANEVGAYTMADIAHIAGLIAAKQLENPMDYFDVVTSSTHKTLRGPRGGIILCKEELKAKIDKAVFPGLQGGPHEHTIAAKAVAFAEAAQPEFQAYGRQVILNAQKLASEMIKRGYDIVTGGTDNHLMLVDLTKKHLTGDVAEKALEKVDISVNKNLIPYDSQKPMVTSGIRIGTPTITTRGMKEDDMGTVAGLIDQTLENRDDYSKLEEIKQSVHSFASGFELFRS